MVCKARWWQCQWLCLKAVLEAREPSSPGVCHGLLCTVAIWSSMISSAAPSITASPTEQTTPLAFNPLACSYCQSGHVLLLNQPCLDTCEAREKTDRDGRCSDFSNAWFWFDSISLMFSSKLYKKHLIRISLSPMCLLALPLIFPEIRSFHFSLEVDVLYIVL